MMAICTPGKSGVSCQERLPEPCQGGGEPVLGVGRQGMHLARQIALQGRPDERRGPSAAVLPTCLAPALAAPEGGR